MYAANDLYGESGVFVIRHHHWGTPCRNIPVKTLDRPQITTDIRTIISSPVIQKLEPPITGHGVSVSALPNGYKTLKTYWSDSLGCLDVIIIILLKSRVNNEFIFYFDTDRYFTPLPPKPSMFMMGVAWGSGPAHLKIWRSNCTFWPYLKWYFGTAETILKTRKSVQSDTIWKLCENNVSKACVLAEFKTIWNCREHFENNVFKSRILVVSETIWNCRKIDENNVHLKHAFWWYLKRFGTAENILKTMSLKHAL